MNKHAHSRSESPELVALLTDRAERRRMLAESYVQRLSELTGADESFMLRGVGAEMALA